MPDLTFYKDPALDRVLGVVMELAEEVYSLRQRLRALSGETAGADEERDAFVARIVAPLSYERESPIYEFEAP